MLICRIQNHLIEFENTTFTTWSQSTEASHQKVEASRSTSSWTTLPIQVVEFCLKQVRICKLHVIDTALRVHSRYFISIALFLAFFGQTLQQFSGRMLNIFSRSIFSRKAALIAICHSDRVGLEKSFPNWCETFL